MSKELLILLLKAFDGYRWQRSDYSEVHCLSCNAMGRTKAKYVDKLPDAKE